MHYVNPTTNGKHVNVCFRMWDYVCDFRMQQNGSLHVVIGANLGQRMCIDKRSLSGS